MSRERTAIREALEALGPLTAGDAMHQPEVWAVWTALTNALAPATTPDPDSDGELDAPSLTETFRWSDGGEVDGEYAWTTTEHSFDEYDGDTPRSYVHETWERTSVEVRWAMPGLYDCDYEDDGPCDEDAKVWQQEDDVWMAACPKHTHATGPEPTEAS